MAINPLDSLNEVELFNTTLMLRLICGRNKAVLPKKRRKYMCSLAGLLDEQATNKGFAPCLPPYHVGQQKVA
jgi:hypothetical protein